MPSGREGDAEHADDQRDTQPVEDGGQDVASLFVGAEQIRPLAFRGPQRRDARIDQFELRGIERVLDGDERREDRERHEQHHDEAAAIASFERRNA